MSSINKLSLDHNYAFKQAELLEKATLECFESRIKLSKKKYLKLVNPNKILFKIDLIAHFKFEEKVLFPVLIRKSKEVERVIKTLLSDHSMIMKRFTEFEDIEDYDLSIQVLNGLLQVLIFHSKTEEELFSSIQLSIDEITRINETAKALQF